VVDHPWLCRLRKIDASRALKQADAANDRESDPAPVEGRSVGAEDRFLHEARGRTLIDFDATLRSDH